MRKCVECAARGQAVVTIMYIHSRRRAPLFGRTVPSLKSFTQLHAVLTTTVLYPQNTFLSEVFPA